MPKISNSNKLIIKIVLKIILFTIISLSITSMIFSYLILKLDLDLKYSEYITYLIISLVAFVVPFLSLSSLKNNGLLIGALSSTPVLIYIIVNAFINDNSIIKTIIKVALVVTISSLSGLLRTKKNRKFKV